jgi:DNA-binding MarR family transcriptional regulator
MKSLAMATNMGSSERLVAGLEGTEGPLSADRCAGLLLDTLPPLMNAMREMIQDTAASDLTVHQFRTLLFIQRHDGASLSDASEFLALALPSTSKLVDQLFKRQLLERGHDHVDRRRMLLRLTERGNALLKDAQTAVQTQLTKILNHLSGEELVALHKTLELLQRSFPSAPSENTRQK